MNVRRMQKGLFFAAGFSMLVLGCELVVDFDRTKIPVDDAGTGIDASPVDGSVTDSSPSTDAGTDATTAADTGADTGTGADADTDAGTDSGATDSGTDA